MFNFEHNGDLGDVIASLPCCIAANKYGGYEKGNFYIGNRMLKPYAEMLLPLLEVQPYFDKVELYNGQKIDICLDLFRAIGFDLTKGDMSRWYFHVWPLLSYDLSQPWLYVEPDANYKDTIIVNRTPRYHNDTFDYSFLEKYKDSILFVGTGCEYNWFEWEKRFNFAHVTFANHKLLAEAIAGCKLFIGNQSYCWHIAEALKIPRILEISQDCPNCIPKGNNGWDCYAGKLMPQLVEHVLKLTDKH